MRILWLSANQGLFFSKNQAEIGYNGGGWITSLQKLLISTNENKLALAYISHKPLAKEEQNNTIYYPIYEVPANALQKIKMYYGGYKKYNSQKYLKQIKEIIQDFHPDIIHLFGMENSMATILGNTTVPVVVHLQGLLGPCDNAFFPVGFNNFSLLFPFSIREWLLRNGYIFAKNSIHIKGKRELSLFKKVEYAMGRTEWDYQVSQLLAPQSKYFHVDEVLREPFYEHAGKWIYQKPDNELRIISTLSNTVYKGLDTVLKTAQILKNQSKMPFRWQIIGLKPNDAIIHFFENKLKIKSNRVNVEYAGILDAPELCERILNSHIFVHPSYIDNSPNSICEAQLLGIPVIGTYVGGIPSLIKNKETGLLIPANDPFQLACILNKYILEKGNMLQLGKQGYMQACQRHDKSKILKDLIDTYKQIIHK